MNTVHFRSIYYVGIEHIKDLTSPFEWFLLNRSKFIESLRCELENLIFVGLVLVLVDKGDY